MLLLSDDCKKQQVTNSLAEFKKKKKKKSNVISENRNCPVNEKGKKNITFSKGHVMKTNFPYSSV